MNKKSIQPWEIQDKLPHPGLANLLTFIYLVKTNKNHNSQIGSYQFLLASKSYLQEKAARYLPQSNWDELEQLILQGKFDIMSNIDIIDVFKQIKPVGTKDWLVGIHPIAQDHIVENLELLNNDLQFRREMYLELLESNY